GSPGPLPLRAQRRAPRRGGRRAARARAFAADRPRARVPAASRRDRPPRAAGRAGGRDAPAVRPLPHRARPALPGRAGGHRRAAGGSRPGGGGGRAPERDRGLRGRRRAGRARPGPPGPHPAGRAVGAAAPPGRRRWPHGGRGPRRRRLLPCGAPGRRPPCAAQPAPRSRARRAAPPGGGGPANFRSRGRRRGAARPGRGGGRRGPPRELARQRGHGGTRLAERGRGEPGQAIAYQAFVTAEAPPPRVLADLVALMPGDVRLDAVSMTYGEPLGLRVEVVARTPSSYDLFLDRLQRSPLFTDVLSGEENRDGELRTSIQMTYRPPE